MAFILHSEGLPPLAIAESPTPDYDPSPFTPGDTQLIIYIPHVLYEPTTLSIFHLLISISPSLPATTGYTKLMRPDF